MTLENDFNVLIGELKDNLQIMGITDAEFDSITGIRGLVARILEIQTGTKFDTTLTLTASETSIEMGETVTLTGNLSVNFTGLNTVGFNLNTILNNQTIKIYNGNTLIDTVTTDNNGDYSLTYTPNENITLIAIFEGNDACLNSNSPDVNITVSLPPLVLTITGSSFTDSSDSSSQGLGGNNISVDWGDGTIENSNGRLSHTYTDGITTHDVKVYNVTDIKYFCFKGCTSLTSVIIPSSVTSLGSYCFNNCGNLTSVTIPSSITSLGNNCFSNCRNLTNVTIHSGITSLSNSCFNNCKKLTNIIIPSGVTSLGGSCFMGSGLTSVTIPSSVTSIGGYCFYGCTALVDYQLYWTTPPKTWNNDTMLNNTNTYFTIPNGCTANYTAQQYPSAKLIERNS